MSGDGDTRFQLQCSEGRGWWISVSLKPTWSIQYIPSQTGLYNETTSQKKQTKVVLSTCKQLENRTNYTCDIREMKTNVYTRKTKQVSPITAWDCFSIRALKYVEEEAQIKASHTNQLERQTRIRTNKATKNAKKCLMLE